MSSCYIAKPGEVQAKWYVVDARDQVLGRMASRIAMILQGKNKPTYTPHVDTGDYVIVLNADQVKVTGQKAAHRTYDTYTGYTSGRHVWTYEEMNRNHPEKVIELAVRRMLPKNKLGKKMLSKLKVYRGDTHEHAAQQPTPLSL